MYDFVCLECRVHFVPNRCDAKFCSTRCRQRHHIRHKRFEAKKEQLKEAYEGVKVLLELSLGEQHTLEKQTASMLQGIADCQEFIDRFPARYHQLEEGQKDLMRRGMPTFGEDDGLTATLGKVLVNISTIMDTDEKKALRRRYNDKKAKLARLKGQLGEVGQQLDSKRQEVSECEQCLAGLSEQLRQPPPKPRYTVAHDYHY